MTNNVLTDQDLSTLEQLAEIKEHIKALNAEKLKLEKSLLSSVGIDDDTQAGTFNFVDSDDSVRLKISISEEISTDDEKLFKALDSIEGSGLLHTVVKPTFKIDKRAYESLPIALKVVIKDMLSYKTKRPSINIA